MATIQDSTTNKPGHRIDKIWAFISEDEKGEGLVGAMIGGSWMPLIAADETRLDDLRKLAVDLAQNTKTKIKLIELSTRTDLETL